MFWHRKTKIIQYHKRGNDNEIRWFDPSSLMLFSYIVYIYYKYKEHSHMVEQTHTHGLTFVFFSLHI